MSQNKLCKKCRKPAFVHLRSANLALCREHYIEYYETKVERALKRYKMLENRKRILVAISGGKDSVAMAAVLGKLVKSKRIDVELVGLYINLGIGEYSKRALEVATKTSEKFEIPLIIYDLKEYDGFSIKDCRFLRRKICSCCGVIKRYVMTKIATEIDADAIATGHTLFDTVAFIQKHFTNGEFAEMARLQPNMETIKDLKAIGRIKPLYECTEEENLLYCIAQDLDFVDDECPFAEPTTMTYWKKVLMDAEKRFPGTTLKFARKYAKELQPILAKHYITIETKTPLGMKKVNFCKICGYPTNSEICAFCRIKINLRKKGIETKFEPPQLKKLEELEKI
ncbi:MAG: ATP-binding protein [Candidatus Asgardarchaeia archaeon]